MNDLVINIDSGKGQLTLGYGDSLLNNVYLSLNIERGSWWYDVNFGSRFHLLRREKDTSSTRRRAVEYAEEALAWLVETKRATAVSAEAMTVDGKLALYVTVTRPVGKPVVFLKFIPVGE